MKLQQLRYFEAACRLNNISRAAEELHVSQPSVSAAIRELEDEFGLSLISRHYQGFTITDEGKILLEMAIALLDHADRVSDKMCMLGKQRRPVRLGIPPMSANLLLSSIYKKLKEQLPDILLATKEVGGITLIHDLRECTLDVSFLTHIDPLPSFLDSISLSSLEAVWCARPDHPLAKYSRISVDQLEDEPLVFFQDDSFFQAAINRQFAQASVSPRILHKSNQLSSIFTIIYDGMATGFLLRPIVRDEYSLIVRPLDPPLIIKLDLVWNVYADMFRDKRRFITFCKQNLIHEIEQ